MRDGDVGQDADGHRGRLFHFFLQDTASNERYRTAGCGRRLQDDSRVGNVIRGPDPRPLERMTSRSVGPDRGASICARATPAPRALLNVVEGIKLTHWWIGTRVDVPAMWSRCLLLSRIDRRRALLGLTRQLQGHLETCGRSLYQGQIVTIIFAAQMMSPRLPMICRNGPRRVGARSETIGRAGG
jgi:hypothetical protein